MKLLIIANTIFIILSAVCAKQNILLIIVDDLRPVLGCYGDKEAHTPNIDGLANRSIIFENAFAQQALCAPSRNSFLTSRRPDTLHLYDFYSYWRKSVGNFTSLPQYFKENGYHTKSIGKVFHPGVSSNWNDDQPYSWSEEPYHPSTEKYKESAVCRDKTGHLHKNLICPVEVQFQPEETLPDLQSLSAAKLFLRQRKIVDQPFFLAIGFQKPHIPLKFPKEYIDFHPFDKISLPTLSSKPPELPNVAWNPWSDIREREDIIALNLSFPFESMPDYYVKKIRQSYYAAVTYIDDLIGELLNEVKTQHFGKNTIILLVGDHGWSLGEHGEWAKYSNYEASVRVPFILYVPWLTDWLKTNLPHTTTNRDLVELVDIFPTLTDLVGLNTPPLCPKDSRNVTFCTEGASLVPLIKQIISHQISDKDDVNGLAGTQWKMGVFSQYPRPGLYPTLHPNSDKPKLAQIKFMGYSLRTQQYRYTEWVQFDRKHFLPDWSQVAAYELYDHFIDDDENFNLSGRQEMKEIMAVLSKQLKAGWRYSLPKKQLYKNII